MVERSGTFRVYRVTESVPQINLQATETPTLYSVYQTGYGDRQEAVDALETGNLVEATLEGDPTADGEPWRLARFERVGDVQIGFAVDVTPPDVARELWTDGQTDPATTVLTADGSSVAACGVQPRAPLPNGAFVPNVLTGLVPLEPQFASVPGVGDPAVEALFLDPDPPGAGSHTTPYGVLLLFTAAGTTLADRFRETYDCPRGADTRPEFDPYGI
jgi:hypothetical protein